MKQLDVTLTPEANDDTNKIYLAIFVQSQNPLVAQKFTDRILTKCEKLGNMPFGRRARDDLLPGLRLFPFERKAIIAYRVTEKAVEITNIFFGGRDYEALYKQDEE